MKKKKNRSIFNISIFFVVMFLAMISYLIYFNVKEAKYIINNPYNKRQEVLAGRVIRGQILSSDGEVLAETYTDDEGAEKRYYPYGPVFSHVVGYKDMGGMGVEKLNSIYMLTSTDNFFDMIVNDITGTKNQGDNIVTTLNSKLQKAAYDALGDNRGAVIVMEPGTGKILAMVSKPDFDPNTLMDKWDEITVEGADSVLYNRATQGLYPPGSTFKLLTMLEYYRENGVNTENYSYVCDGAYELSGHSIRCMQQTAHGKQNIYESLAHSCNCSFINMGLSTDIHRFSKTAEELLFNSKLPIELEYNKSSFSLNEDSDMWEIAQTSFGQGKTLVTPMHLALITNAIACDGKVMTPYLVDRIENCKKATVKRFKPELFDTIMTSEETKVLEKGMKMVTEQAFAWLYGDNPYSICAKSGSAQYGTMGYEHSLFVSYAPADQPEISVTVVVEGGSGRNTSAAEVANKIYEIYFNKNS